MFKGASHRAGTNMLDITLLGSDATGEVHIRIAEMCDLLDRRDSTMPTPRKLWQFRTFRWDNAWQFVAQLPDWPQIIHSKNRNIDILTLP